MSQITFKQLELSDLPRLNHFLKQRKQQSANKGDLNYWLTDQQRILACARLEILDNNSYWLRGVYVDEAFRKQGLGSLLIKDMHATLTKHNQIIAFPYAHLNTFYSQLGYVDLAPEQLPDKLAVRYQQAQQQNKNWLCMIYSAQ